MGTEAFEGAEKGRLAEGKKSWASRGGRAVANPPMIPAQAPARLIPFQYRLSA